VTSPTNALANMFVPQERLYVFTVDILDPAFNTDALLTYMRDAATVTNWSYPLPGTFLIRSYYSAHYLSEALRKMVNGVSCLVIEADPNNKGGWLPRPAWDWFNPPQRAAGLGLGAAKAVDFLSGKKDE
jgi:hypothetical protein